MLVRTYAKVQKSRSERAEIKKWVTHQKLKHVACAPMLKETNSEPRQLEWMDGRRGRRWIGDPTQLSQRTYILDIIRSYGLVVAIYGSFSYNNNVQPFLIGSILEGRKEAETFTNMTENLLHFQKLDPVMEDILLHQLLVNLFELIFFEQTCATLREKVQI